MTSLKEHQAAMVALLASGAGIPASASRLAHAMHDVLAQLNNTATAPVAHTERRIGATTSGLNDALLARDLAAVRRTAPSVEDPRIKQLKNTIRQLKDRVSSLVADKASLEEQLNALTPLPDTETDWAECQHDYIYHDTISAKRCLHCGDVK